MCSLNDAWMTVCVLYDLLLRVVFSVLAFYRCADELRAAFAYACVECVCVMYQRKCKASVTKFGSVSHSVSQTSSQHKIPFRFFSRSFACVSRRRSRFSNTLLPARQYFLRSFIVCIARVSCLINNNIVGWLISHRRVAAHVVVVCIAFVSPPPRLHNRRRYHYVVASVYHVCFAYSIGLC